jgi:hypothetical protein
MNLNPYTALRRYRKRRQWERATGRTGYGYFGDNPRPMNGFEYQRFYDCGVMPPRFWDGEIIGLKEKFLRGELTVQELEDSLDDMMGITFAESMGHPPYQEEEAI